MQISRPSLRRRMLSVVLLLLIGTLLTAVGVEVLAQQSSFGNTVIPESVFVRSGPGQSYTTVGALYAGDLVRPLNISEDGEWVLIPYRRQYGWIQRILVAWQDDAALDRLPELEADITPTLLYVPTFTPLFATYTPVGNYISVIGAAAAYVRAGPSQDYPRVGDLQPGDVVLPVGRNPDTSWILIRFQDEFTDFDGFGWIGRNLVRWENEAALKDLPFLISSNLTPSPTFTATATPSTTATASPIDRETSTPQPTATDTATNTLEPTATDTATHTPEPTAMNTVEPTATNTSEPTATDTVEPTATDTATNTAEPTATDTQAAALNPAFATNTPPVAATNTPESTITNTPEPTATETATNTSEPTATETATNTPEPTATEATTNTPEPTATETATTTPEPTATETATNTPEPTATEAATNTPEPTATETATNTPQPTATETAIVVAQAATETLIVQPTQTETVAPVIAALPVTLTPTPLTTTATATPTGRVPAELIVAGIVLLLLLVYGVLYVRGLGEIQRYENGFVVETCPVCGRGHLTVETRVERLLGIPRARRIVRCDQCRSVLRETGRGRWRYAVDRIENSTMYDRLNGQVLAERDLRALTNSVPVVKPTFEDDAGLS